MPSYVIGVARNVLNEFRRDQAKIQYDEYDVEWVISRDGEVDSDIAKAIKIAKSKLTLKQRQAIEAVYYDGLTVKQAAKMLGCNEQVLSRRLCDAIKRLRKSLNSDIF